MTRPSFCLQMITTQPLDSCELIVYVICWIRALNIHIYTQKFGEIEQIGCNASAMILRDRPDRG